MKVSWVLASLMLGVAEAKIVWSSLPATFPDIIRQAFPVGNGKLGVLPFSDGGTEKLSLNIDSLWSGGPFQASVSFTLAFQTLRALIQAELHRGESYDPEIRVPTGDPRLGVAEWNWKCV